MITLDFKNETPIQKSHDWIGIDSHGVWNVIKDFSYLPYHVVRMLHVGSQAIFDGDSMIVYDHDYNYYLVIFDKYSYKAQSFGYGTTIEVLNSGNIIIQTESALHCLDRDLNEIWQIPRDGRGYAWYDRKNNVLYSPQGSSIDAINPDTGTIIKSGSLPYNDFAAVKVGNYILAPRRNTNKTFDLDLNLVKDGFQSGNYSNILPAPMLAGDNYWIGSYGIGYYSTAEIVYFQVNPDGTYSYLYTFPMTRSLGLNSNGTGDLINFDRIGTKHDKYWAFVKDNALGYTYSKFGYVPVNEEIYMIYKINTSRTIQAAFFDNKASVVRATDSIPVDIYYYHVFISKDMINWQEIESGQDLQSLALVGDIYIKLTWEPYSFSVPVLQSITLTEDNSYYNMKTIRRQGSIKRSI